MTLPRAFWVPLSTAVVVLVAAIAVVVVRAGESFATLEVLGSQIDRNKAIAHRGAELEVKDLLETSPSGFGQVNYFEGSLTRLDKDTKFIVKELAKGDDRVIRVRLDVGRTWNNVKRVTGSETTRVEVETPNAVAAVRGTIFIVACDAQRTCTFTVLDGRVEVKPNVGPAFMLDANQRIAVGPDGAPVLRRPPAQPGRRGRRTPPPPTPDPNPVLNVSPEELAQDEWIQRNVPLDRKLPGRDFALPTLAPTPPPSPAPTPKPTAKPTPSPTPKPAAPVTVPGTIVFMDREPGEGEEQIYVMNADGSGRRRLTNGLIGARDPAWSPDKLRIAFQAKPTKQETYDVYVINADGSGLQKLTDNAVANANDESPTWSPDGLRIAYSGVRDNYRGILVMNADGSAKTALTTKANSPGSYGDRQPDWSPDGGRIAFCGRDGKGEIFVMTATGSGVTNLTRSAAGGDTYPDWSPDGTRIVYLYGGTIEGDDRGGIRIISATDGARIGGPLTPPANVINHNSPAWSPDGARIAYSDGTDIYVVNPDGSGRTKIGRGRLLDW